MGEFFSQFFATIAGVAIAWVLARSDHKTQLARDLFGKTVADLQAYRYALLHLALVIDGELKDSDAISKFQRCEADLRTDIFFLVIDHGTEVAEVVGSIKGILAEFDSLVLSKQNQTGPMHDKLYDRLGPMINGIMRQLQKMHTKVRDE